MYYKENIEKDTIYRKEYSQTIDEFLAEHHKKALESESFMSPLAYKQDMETWRERFVEFLGFPLLEKREKPKLLRKDFVVKDNNVNIYRMQFLFFDRVKFYGIWFEQCDTPQEKPFVIGLHGDCGTAEMVASMHLDSANYNHLVRRMTDRGANVFVPQLYLWDIERYGTPYNRMRTDAKCRKLGGSMTAFELYILRGCIDYFLAEGMTQTEIGVAGLSYGGMYALHLAAIDKRIKACYSSNWLCDSFALPVPDWCFLNAEHTFSVAETAALICPRALVVGTGLYDVAFPYQKTEKECEKIKKYYDEFNKSENFKLVVFEGDHELDKKDEEFDFFFEKLLREI